MTKERILWMIFFLNISVVTTFSLLQFLPNTSILLSFLMALILIIPILQLFLNSYWVLGFNRAIFFIILASCIGLTAEAIGVRFGGIFGVPYIYTKTAFMIFDVPVQVIFFWAVFIYTGYSLTNLTYFLYKKYFKQDQKQTIPIVIFLSFLDAITVTAIDLIMDPIQVSDGRWTWSVKGPYFGIPLGNFFGWISVSFFVCFIYRIFEYYCPQKSSSSTWRLLLISFAGYACTFIGFIIQAIEKNMWSLAGIGFFVMVILCIFPFILLVLNQKKQYLL